MKKKLLLAAAACFGLAANAQIIYTDIADASATLTPPGVNEFVSIDYNNDGTEEYNFRWDIFAEYWFLHVTFGNDNEIIKKAGATWSATYVEPLSENDLISSAADWGNSFPEPFVGDYLDDNFMGLGDRYIGTKFTLNGNTHYGWILVSFSDDFLFTVKSYAYESTPNTPINAGATGVARLNGFTADSIKLYPNPAGSSVTLECDNGFNEGFVTITDMTGKQVSRMGLDGDPFQQTIDVSALQPGMYLLTFSGRNGVSATKKFIKL